MNCEEEAKMTTASRRRCPLSPAASPLDDDNLLCEILLRLPPQPSSLPRASAVCKRWRRLVADPRFFRRFRLHHCRNLPLLGFFYGYNQLTFVPTLGAPNRVHRGRFSLPSGIDNCFQCLGCRHGLALIYLHGAFIDTNNAVLAGDSLYWLLAGNSDRILEFDLVKQGLDVIQVPADMCGDSNHVRIMRPEGGGLGVLLESHSDCTVQLWKRKTDCDGVTSWGLERTIELDKLLSLKSEEKVSLRVLGYGEDNNVVFVRTVIGLFMIHLKSLKFEKLFEAKTISFSHCHPFESVYAAETCADGGQGGTEVLRNV